MLKSAMKAIIGFLVFFLSITEVTAQLDSLHWIPPMHSRNNQSNNIADHYIYLSTPETSSFQVTVTDGEGNALAGSPYAISNSSPQRIQIGNGQIPASELMVPDDSLNKPVNKVGLKLTASEEFYVNARYRARNQAGSLTSKGRSAEGKEFRVGVMPIPSDGGFLQNRRNFATGIMATEDNTSVDVSDYDPGVVFNGPSSVTKDSLSFTLDSGECYVLSGYTSTSANLDGFIGALIESNKDIVVNTGNWLGSISSPSTSQDIGVDQIVPVKRLGKDYASVVAEGQDKQERPMVVAAEDNTKVFTNDNATADATLQAGEYYLIPNNRYSGSTHENMYIHTSKPAYVYQFLAGNTDPATPGMNFLAPLFCGLPSEVDLIPSIKKIGSNSYNGKIIAFTKKGETLKVNGNKQTGAEKLTGFSSWETYKISGFSGDVSITSTGPMAAGFYGVNVFAGYGGLFSGFSLDISADFKFLDTITYADETTSCFNDTIEVKFTGKTENSTKIKWDFGDAPIQSTPGKPTKFADSNTGPYKLLYKSQNYSSVVRDSIQVLLNDDGCKDSIKKALRIFEVNPGKASIENVSVFKNSIVKVNLKGVDVKDLNRYTVMRKKGNGAFKPAKKIVNPDTPDKKFQVFDTVNTRDTQLCYTIATVRGCRPTAYSDTLCATQLEGRPSNNANQLTWQRFSGYPLDSQLVLRKAGSVYDTIARLAGSATTYTDQPLPCNVPESYKVLSLEKGGERTTLSDSTRLTPFDTLAPGALRIQRLSILSDNEARLSWLRSDSSVTRHGLWLKAKGQAWRIIDTVGFQNTYTFTGLDTRDSQYCARIVGIDSCANNPSAFSKPHCAVQLEGRASNLKNILNWQAYEGFSNPSYEVQRLTDGTWQVLGSTSDTSYTDSVELTCGVTERYRIRTVSGDQTDTSFSDTTAVTPVDTIAPPAADLRFASANTQGEVKVQWEWQTTTNQKYFEIWRDTGLGNFQRLDTVTYDSTYTDQTARPADIQHQYYIIATDSCRATNRSAPSDTDRLMVPKATTGACQPQNVLSWNAYDDLPQGTDVYELYRNQPATSNEFNLQTTNNEQQTTYTDNNVNDNTTYCYRIKAVDTQSGYSSWTDSFCRKVFEYPEPDTPDLISASVTRTGATNGAAKLTWDRYKADTFAEGYALYHQEQGSSGSYQRIQTTGDLDDTTYTHTGINTANKRNSYRLVVYNQCGDTSAFSETHTTIDLEASNRNLEVQLDWSAYEGFFVAGYDVERATDGGQWETITFLTRDTSLTDTTVECGKRYTYRVIAYDQTGYSAFSDTLVRKAFDTIDPEKPELTSASVTQTGANNGAVRLNWQPSSSADLEKYVIQHYQPNVGEFQMISPVSADSTSYLHQEVNTADRPNRYIVKAVDSCGNSSKTKEHRTIHLEAEGISEAASLEWTAYQGRTVQTYQVIRGDSVLYEVPGDSTRKLDQDISCDSTYTYQIRAVLANDSTVVLSNTDQASPFDNNPPDAFTLQRVSVADFNEVVEVKWQVNNERDLDAYEVFRSTERSDGLKLVGRVQESTEGRFYDTFDLEGASDICYQVRATDNCGNESQLSSPDCVMKLDGEALEALENRLNWPPYQQWDNGVAEYRVFKQRSDSLYTNIAALDSSKRSYLDENLADSADQFCYYIRAKGLGTEQFSRSTSICLEQSAIVHIPNTFTPATTQGLNDQFGPEGLYIQNYQMQIYNRWGEEVFSTSKSEKWDGIYNGEMVPQGIYQYKVLVLSEDGSRETFSGQVTVIR
jgi:gliding motility-associated-like protein